MHTEYLALIILNLKLRPQTSTFSDNVNGLVPDYVGPGDLPLSLTLDPNDSNILDTRQTANNVLKLGRSNLKDNIEKDCRL